MKYCLKCLEYIPSNCVIDGKLRNLQRRKFCVKCSPFGQHNTTNLNKVRVQKKKSINVSNFRRRRKKKLVELMGGKCSRCGYDKCVGALEFHHINPNLKSFGISARGLCKSLDKVIPELQKCILICANCHREIEWGANS